MSGGVAAKAVLDGMLVVGSSSWSVARLWAVARSCLRSLVAALGADTVATAVQGHVLTHSGLDLMA